MTADGEGKALVVGLGNEYRGDDGVGIFMARLFARRNPAGYEVMECHGDEAALVALWEGYKTAVIFDSVWSGAPAGTVYRFRIPPDSFPRSLFSCSTHSFGLADAVEMARSLGTLPEELIVYGIEGAYFGTGAELSDVVRDAAVKVIDEMEERRCMKFR